MSQTTNITKSRTPYIVIGVVLAIIGGPILMLPIHVLLNAILSNPATGTSSRAIVNIGTLLVWPICLIIGLYLAIFAGKKRA
jgi:hypothetical protein